MINTTWTYPGDRPSDVTLMTGLEFEQAHPNREAKMIVSGEIVRSWPVTEIICDSCSNLVDSGDRCALTMNQLYCWSCFERWIKPYLAAPMPVEWP